MSLILEALKKLDREKASRRTGMPDLAAEILRPEPALPRKRLPMYLLAVSLTALATAGITYALIGKPGFLSKLSPPSAGIHPATGQKVASAPAAKLSPPAPATPPASPRKREPASVKPGAPSKRSTSATSRSTARAARAGAASPKPSPPAKLSPGKPAIPSLSVQKVPPAAPESGVLTKPSSPAPASSPEPRRQVASSPPSQDPIRGLQSGAKPEVSKIPAGTGSRLPVISPGHKDATPKGTSREVKPAPGTAPKPAAQVSGSFAVNPPALKISGIVWNEEPSKRRAVINGSFTTEGSMIEGAKVVEIFPTKVLFLHQGRYFEISVF
jgi:general secretion pathway protein B